MIGGIGMEVNNAIRLIEDFGITLKGAAKESRIVAMSFCEPRS